MKIITLYLIKTLIHYIFIISFVLIAIISIFNFLAEFKYIGTNSYNVLNALYFLLLKIPTLVYDISIAIILISVVLAISYLSNSSQLIIIKSVGYSIKKISAITVSFSAVIMIIIMLIGEFIAPKTFEYANNYKVKMLSTNGIISPNINNLWIKNNNYTININQNLTNAIIMQIDNNKLIKIISAKKITINEHSSILNDVNINEIKANNITTKHYDNYELSLHFDNNLLNTLVKKPNSLTILELNKQINFLKNNNINAKYLIVELYARLFKLIILITAVTIAMLFLFNLPRNSSIVKNISIGIFLALFFDLVSRINSAIAIKFDYNYIMVAVMPVILILILSIFLLFKKSNK